MDFSNVVMGFSHTELLRFNRELLTWDDELLVKIADPLLFAVHKNFPFKDRVAMYGKIFFKVNDPEILNYLLVNIHVIAHIPPGKEPLDFYIAVVEKIRELTNGNYRYMELLDRKMELELKKEVLELADIPEKVIRMYVLHTSTDKVKRLFDYLVTNANRSGIETWHLIHDSILKNHINVFSVEECRQFEEQMLNWDAQMLFDVACAIAESDNAFLNGKAIFCDICFKTNKGANLDYLIKNFAAHFNAILPGSRSINYYEEGSNSLKERLTQSGYEALQPLFAQKIQAETQYRRKSPDSI